MNWLIEYLFGAASFVPHGYCLLWRPDLVAIHATSDALIALSYFSIPIALMVFVRRRRDLEYPWVFKLFGAFILMCGLTHVVGLVTLWQPIYGAQGLVKAVTAGVSVATAIVLWPLIPRALSLPSQADLVSANAALRQALDEREAAVAELEALFESAPDATLIVDKSGRIARANKRAADLFGYDRDELAGAPLETLVPERYNERHTALRQGLAEKAEQDEATSSVRNMGSGLEIYGRRQDGEELPVDVSLAPITYRGRPCYCASVRDVTEQRRARDELAHAQKLDAIGKLTGGLAHDFNNFLSAVLANLQIMRRRLGENATVAGDIDACMRAARRGVELTRRLLAFGRQQPLSPQPTSISGALEEIRPLLSHAAHSQIQIEVAFPDDDAENLAAMCDSAQLQAVLITLVANARDALADRTNGRITITARRVTLPEHAFEESEPLAGGDYVEIAVADNGQGMSEETLRRATEPFFTTKPNGSGTGLGLSMAYGFLRQSQGHLHLESRLDEGTTAYVYLPVAELEPQGAAIERSETEPGLDTGAAERPAAPKRILVVDDDEEVMPATVQLLRDSGHDAVGARTQWRATELFCNQGPFDIVLCDLYLSSGEDGAELATELKTIDSSANVIMMTGYVLDRDFDRSKLPGPVLAKPISVDNLLDMIEQPVPPREEQNSGQRTDRG